MTFAQAADALARGQTVRLKVHGQSMRGRIPSGSTVTIEPRATYKYQDAVLCKVRGRFCVHLIRGVMKRDGVPKYLIGNNVGGINGWTHQVFGLVTEVS